MLPTWLRVAVPIRLPCCTKAGPIGAAEVFDPASGTWTPIAGMTSARVGHSATLLPNGNVLVAGGQAQASGGAWLTSEIYDPTAGTWTATGNLAAPRTFHSATLLTNGKVLAVGGWTTNFVTLATAELYTP
jgi:N-acetylneuraminic acid mutarotase